MAKPWTNADGLQVRFGNYHTDLKNRVNTVEGLNTLGTVKELVINYDLSKIAAGTVSYTSDLNNDGTADGFNTGDVYLPAYSSVLRVTVIATEAAAGGTSIEVGTYALTGAAIDADGLVTATEGVLANLNTVGGRTFGAGAYVAAAVDTPSIGAADGYVGIAATGTFTAGKGIIVIEYITPVADA